MKDIFAVPACIQKISTLADRTIRLVVDTEKELYNEEEAKIMKLRQKSGWFVFSDQELQKEDIPDTKLDEEIGETKSPSQRLRNSIYKVWETRTNKSVDWDTFYRQRMEKHINIEKEKII